MRGNVYENMEEPAEHLERHRGKRKKSFPPYAPEKQYQTEYAEKDNGAVRKLVEDGRKPRKGDDRARGVASAELEFRVRRIMRKELV